MCSSFFTKQQMFQVSAQKSSGFMIKRMWILLLWNVLECCITEQAAGKPTAHPSPLLASKPTPTHPLFVAIKPQSISFPRFPFFQHCRADVSITFWYPSLTCVWMLVCPHSCSLKSEFKGLEKWPRPQAALQSITSNFFVLLSGAQQHTLGIWLMWMIGL